MSTKKIFSRLLCLVIVLSLCIIATACANTEKEAGAPSEKEVAQTTEKDVIQLWDFRVEKEAEGMQELVKRYNELHDDVEIKYQSVNQSDYTTTLITTAFANGECPDIICVEAATYNKFVDAGILADLTPYYNDELLSDLLPSFVEAATADDGKIYTLPFECETVGLFYNVDVLEAAGIAPPTTWEELYAAAAALTTEDMYGLVMPVENTPYTLYNWWPFMWMNGANIYSPDGELVINSEEMATALDFWGSFFQNDYAPSSLQIGPWSIDNIATGFAAMQLGGTYMINAAEAYAEQGINIGAIALPSPDGSTYYTCAGGQMMGVCSQSENKDAAAEFIFWAFGDTEDIDIVTNWLTNVKFAFPTRKSVVEQNQDVFASGLKANFTAFYETAIPEPQLTPAVTDIVGDMLQKVMFGGYTGAEAAAEAEALIKALG